jgi:DNA topoisomerase I
MTKNLVIVESPAKAKTIESFLGKEYTVMSSFGHVRDLKKSDLSVDVENGFAPYYEIPSDKKKLVSDLKKTAKAAETVWLASDEDREGEAISWHLVEALDLKEEKVKRIVFHEITKEAILHAIENPRSIDINLVDAQQARRVLDRLVGYGLSPLLWKKVKPSLSAGRVQSVAVRLIVEREKAIKEFKTKSAFRILAVFQDEKDSKKQIKAELPQRFDKQKEAEEFLQKCIGANFSVGKIEKKPAKKSPTAPFTTSTLQQEASRKLGYSVARTMMLAQQLYESGNITYMRTDSVNLSNTAITQAKAEIEQNYGKEYLKVRKYTTKTKGAQEAHEAIRPTYLNKHAAGKDASQKKLYELIWKRTIASQMSDAKLEKTTLDIDISTCNDKFVAKGEVISFDGFLKVYMESYDEEENNQESTMLPPLKEKDLLKMNSLQAIERFSKHPARFTEASLVKQMEEKGIGRPSTYAPTISTIQKRGYILKEDLVGNMRSYNVLEIKKDKVVHSLQEEKTGFEKAKLIPSDIGTLVNDFLSEYFMNILDFNFTAKVEKEFDEIAQGKKAWNKMIDSFYSGFHLQIKEIGETTKRYSGERLLGVDPKSQKNVFVKIGRYGSMAQIGETGDEEKPKFAGLLKGQSIQNITLEEVLELFVFPKSIGEYEGDEVVVAVGRYGPYVKNNSKFYSVSKEENLLKLTLEQAIKIIEDKKANESKKNIKEFKEDGIQVLNGRYGPYIKASGKNYRIPKSMEPEKLSLEDCKEIIAKTAKKKVKK